MEMEMKQMDVDHTGGQKSISIHIIPTHSIPLSLPQEKVIVFDQHRLCVYTQTLVPVLNIIVPIYACMVVSFEKRYSQVHCQHIAILWYKKMIAPLAKENLGVPFR